MIAIIGGGRMGRGMAVALAEAGERVELWSRREAEGGWEGTGPGEVVAGAKAVILAVPDGEVTPVAERLAVSEVVNREQTVLHLSGLLDRGALAPLDVTGAALGSFHPLQTVAEATTAAARWRGAWVALEGDARALATGEWLAQCLGLRPIRIPAAAKPLYHAGAVMASNYLVTLAAVAGRWAAAAGVPGAEAGRIYLPLLEGAVANLGALTPAEALTGPIRRGDVATVRRHLQALPAADRLLYAVLGLEALGLAREAGLGEREGDAIARLLNSALQEGLPPGPAGGG